MSYKPPDEDGVEAKVLSGGSQIAIPNTIGGFVTLKTYVVTNSELYPIVVLISTEGHLHTETINGGARCQMEGRFSAHINSGTLYGTALDYVEIHLQGSNSVVSSTRGFPAGEAFSVSGNLSVWATIPAGAARTFTLRYTASQVAQNFRTAGGLGYVQIVDADMLIMQARGEGLDVAVV